MHLITVMKVYENLALLPARGKIPSIIAVAFSL